jgi:hypothetical protein
MNTQQLAALLQAAGLQAVAEAIRNPAAQALHGWDLTRWRTESVAGAVLFVHLDDAGLIDDTPRVLVVNAPETDRATWEELAKGHETDVTILLLPGGEPQ